MDDFSPKNVFEPPTFPLFFRVQVKLLVDASTLIAPSRLITCWSSKKLVEKQFTHIYSVMIFQQKQALLSYVGAILLH